MTPSLTVRELDVLCLVAAGLTNEAIGRRLGLSHDIAKACVTNLLRKLDARDRAHAVTRGFQHGLLKVADRPTGGPFVQRLAPVVAWAELDQMAATTSVYRRNGAQL